MIAKMVVEKAASLIRKYFHKDFIIYANGQNMKF